MPIFSRSSGPVAPSLERVLLEKTRVLIVDDSDTDAVFTERALKGIGVKHTRRGSSGEQGLEMLQSEPFDIAIIDQKLPGVTGLQVIEWARKHCPQVMTILQTGGRDDRIAASAIKVGAYAYVPKDEFFSSALGTAVTSALRGRQEALHQAPATQEDADRRWRAELEWLESYHPSGLQTRHEDAGISKLDGVLEDFTRRYVRRSWELSPEIAWQEEEELIVPLAEANMWHYIRIFDQVVREELGSRDSPRISPLALLCRLLVRLTIHQQTSFLVTTLSNVTQETEPDDGIGKT